MSELPPENSEPYGNPNQLADMEFELPESEELPPGDVQTRLEEPSGVHNVYDEVGDLTVLETGFVTEAGVTRVWKGPEETAKKKDQLTAAESNLSAGQVQQASVAVTT